MKLILKNFNKNPAVFMRSAGYAFQRAEGNEMSFTRLIGGEAYPRFHAYIKHSEQGLIINLHLDQKRPRYRGTVAHSGEYDSELVKEEVKRIEKLN